jgi:hypothetical protein
VTAPSVNYWQRKRLSRSMPNRRKPKYSAVFAYLAALRRARAAAYDCIKDGIFIEIITSRLIQFKFSSVLRNWVCAFSKRGVQAA